MSILRLINETEITSSVSSVDITDVFSANFDIYKITSQAVSNTSALGTRLRYINSSGSVISASNYDYARLVLYTYQAFGEGRATNQDHQPAFFGSSDVAPEGTSAVAYIFNPYSSSSYTFAINQTMSVETTNEFATKYIGVFKQTTSVTGFRAYTSTDSFDTGTIFRTYGLRVDS